MTVYLIHQSSGVHSAFQAIQNTKKKKIKKKKKIDVKSLGQFKTESTIFSFYFDLFELVVGQNKFWEGQVY